LGNGVLSEVPGWLQKINPHFVIIFDYIVRLTMGIVQEYTIAIVAISLQNLLKQAR
jgi:hypothetical protein